jgi:hypothetical protein
VLLDVHRRPRSKRAYRSSIIEPFFKYRHVQCWTEGWKSFLRTTHMYTNRGTGFVITFSSDSNSYQLATYRESSSKATFTPYENNGSFTRKATFAVQGLDILPTRVYCACWMIVFPHIHGHLRRRFSLQGRRKTGIVLFLWKGRLVQSWSAPEAQISALPWPGARRGYFNN